MAILAAGPGADDGRRLYFPAGESRVFIYDRQTGWLPIDNSVFPDGLCVLTAAFAWSGSEVIGWGPSCASGGAPVGGRYQPAAPP